jgi:hypothetical protein
MRSRNSRGSESSSENEGSEVVACMGAVCVREGWRGRVGARGTCVGTSSMVVSDESLLVDGERVRGVEVREAMLGVARCRSPVKL